MLARAFFIGNDSAKMSSKLHWWIEWPAKRQALVFLIMVCAATVLCWLLPSDAWQIRWPAPRKIPLPGIMLVCWVSGWFTFFFVRAEDLNVLIRYDFEATLRKCAYIPITLGAFIGIHLTLRFLLR